jgi:hypothetical protein
MRDTGESLPSMLVQGCMQGEARNMPRAGRWRWCVIDASGLSSGALTSVL